MPRRRPPSPSRTGAAALRASIGRLTTPAREPPVPAIPGRGSTLGQLLRPSPTSRRRRARPQQLRHRAPLDPVIAAPTLASRKSAADGAQRRQSAGPPADVAGQAHAAQAPTAAEEDPRRPLSHGAAQVWGRPGYGILAPSGRGAGHVVLRRFRIAARNRSAGCRPGCQGELAGGDSPACWQYLWERKLTPNSTAAVQHHSATWHQAHLLQGAPGGTFRLLTVSFK